MTLTGAAKGPSDQKTLNEEIIEGLAEVARRNPQHAVELFGVPLGVAMRLAAMLSLPHVKQCANRAYPRTSPSGRSSRPDRAWPWLPGNCDL